MSSSSADRDPIEILADEFIQRRRRGERPSLAEYVERYPQWADEIRAIFPAMLMLEEAGPASAAGEPRIALRAAANGSAPRHVGDYRILREIGRGGMGIVYEAEQQSLDRRVALKILPWHATQDGTALERFRREARAAARLHHSNIVPVFEVGQDGDTFFYAMQFIQGQSLDRVLTELRVLRSDISTVPAGNEVGESSAARELAFSLWRENFAPPAFDAGQDATITEPALAGVSHDTSAPGSTVRNAHAPTQPVAARLGGLPGIDSDHRHYFRSIARVVRQAAEALGYAHSRGVVHRDIKPSNLLLDAAGVVWITDFGLAKTGAEALTRTGDLVGTLRYMAPERLEGQCDARADIYSLGATLYELLTFQPVYVGDGADLITRIRGSEPTRPRELDPRIPRDLETIVLKAIDRNPKHRYRSAAALAEDLRRFLEDEPILARRIPPAERFARWVRHNRVLATAAMGFGAILLTVAVGSSVAGAKFRLLAGEERKARLETTGHLYNSLVREAEATRLARREGYRSRVWSLLGEARQLETPEVDVDELRREAIQSMGDFVGLAPKVIEGLPAKVRVVAIDRRSRYVAVGLESGLLQFFDPVSGRRLATEKGHDSAIDKLEFLPDDSLLSADRGGAVKLWRRKPGGRWEADDLPHVSGKVLALRAAIDGRLLVATRPDEGLSPLRIVDLRANQHRSVDGGQATAAAAFNRDGTLLATVGGDEVQLWTTATGGRVERKTSDLGPLLGVAFSADGKLLLATSDQGVVIFRVPDLAQQTFTRYDYVPAGTFSPDGETVAFTSRSRRIVLWSVLGNHELAVLAHPGVEDLHSAVFSGDGKLLISADDDSLRLWNLAGTNERLVLKGHAGVVSAIAFSQKGKRLITAGHDRMVAHWDTATGKQITMTELKDAVEALALSTDRRFVAAGGRGGTIDLLNGGSLASLGSVPHRLGAVHGLEFSPEGERLAACGQHGVSVWRVPPGESEAASAFEPPLDLDQAESTRLSFSSDGRFVGWLTRSGHVRLYDLVDGIRWPLNVPALPGGARPLVFHPDGRHLMFIGPARQIVAWDVITDRQAYTIAEPDELHGSHLAMAAGGRWLATDRGPLEVEVWDVETRRAVFALHEERTAISALAWSRDRRLLAVGTREGQLTLWNLPSLRSALASLDLEWPPGQSVAVTPAGQSPRELLAASVEKTPDDARLIGHWGAVLARVGEDERALAELSRSLKLAPGNRQALWARAELHARRAEWQAAAQDYRTALIGERASVEQWYQTAPVLALADDAAAYREHCRQMLALLEEDADAETLQRTLAAALLMPGGVDPETLPLRRLESRLEGAAGVDASRGWLTLGLAAYRRGNADGALDCIRRAQREPDYSLSPTLQALAFVTLALVQYDLRQTSLATDSLRTGREFLGSGEAGEPNGRPGFDRLVFEVLAREADGLIRGTRAGPDNGMLNL